MTITILSVNHHKASLLIREKVALSKDEISVALSTLYQLDEINSCAIVSTCNRVEVLVVSEDKDINNILINWFAQTHQISSKEIVPYLLFLHNEEAINHLCSVASGLNSLVIGEPQILGQLKQSYQQAKQVKTLDKILDKLFQHAFWTAKHIRTQTDIGNSPVSIAYCGVKLAQQIFSDLSAQQVLLIGANEMIELSIAHFIEQKVEKIIIANRTLKNAQRLANKYPKINIKAISLSQIHDILDKADIVISSTASPVPILGKGLFETALKKRKRKPIFILDIAVPRDVEPEVSQLEDIYLYSIDDLELVINQNKQNRQQAIEIAQDLIKEKTQVFQDWLSKRPNDNLVKVYYQNANKITQDLAQKALKRLEQGEDNALVIKTLAEQLTNKLLHQNFQNIKTASPDMLKKCQQCVPIVTLNKK